jgi:hypothetical protein
LIALKTSVSSFGTLKNCVCKPWRLSARWNTVLPRLAAQKVETGCYESRIRDNRLERFPLRLAGLHRSLASNSYDCREEHQDQGSGSPSSPCDFELQGSHNHGPRQGWQVGMAQAVTCLHCSSRRVQDMII